MSKTNIMSFKNQLLAHLSGDDNTVIAEKRWRQANSAFTSHIAQMEGKTIDFEDAVETAEENYKLACINSGNSIDDKAGYVRRVIESKNRVTTAIQNLNDHNEELAILKKVLLDLEGK
jgi:hypothetical protein